MYLTSGLISDHVPRKLLFNLSITFAGHRGFIP
jgi:uncharacterized protein (DUF2249 family)